MRVTKTLCFIFAALLCVSFSAHAQRRGLDLYFVDTEGGAATLIVTPAGESVLIDSGNPGDRDADRIYEAAKAAHLSAIDHVITTHWHLDHYGGIGHLSTLLPLRHFYDRGIPAVSTDDPTNFPTLIAAYNKASHGRSTTLRPGDAIRLRRSAGGPAMEMITLCANKNVVPDRPNAPSNPVAREFTPKQDDVSDNANSLGFLLAYGPFRFLDLGDLTWNIEAKLVMPTDKIGPIDVYQVTHHGLEISNNPIVIKTIQPRVAIFSNGPYKGATPEVLATLRALPTPPTIYQIHKNMENIVVNAPPMFVANGGEPIDQARYIKVSVAPDGKSYTVTIGLNGAPLTYQTRTPPQ